MDEEVSLCVKEFPRSAAGAQGAGNQAGVDASEASGPAGI